MRFYYNAPAAPLKAAIVPASLTLEDAAAALSVDGNPHRIVNRIRWRCTPGGREVIGGSRKSFLMHVVLPYGRWTCTDGRSVLHNRFY